jgi:hypothetical protein
MPVKIKPDDDGFTVVTKILFNLLLWAGECVFTVWVGTHLLSFVARIAGK